MTIIAVDDERIALQLLITSIHEALPNIQIHGFSRSEEVISFCRDNLCELAFLDVDMGNMNGIVLGQHLKKLNPKMNIIFVTAHKTYAVDALSLHSSGYVLKPATKEKIEYELENLRYPLSLFNHNKIWVQCFGNFEIFSEGKPLQFAYNKTKELLAYLIDRKGAYCSNGEIIEVLWEDTDRSGIKKSYLRDLKSDLMRTLSKLNMQHIICKKRGAISILPSKIDCDYYNWIKGDIQSINTYRGEYMTQYSWGEFTLGGIEMVNNNLK